MHFMQPRTKRHGDDGREERYEQEKVEDLDRWQRYMESGDAVSHETVMAWLDDLAVEADRRALRR